MRIRWLLGIFISILLFGCEPQFPALSTPPTAATWQYQTPPDTQQVAGTYASNGEGYVLYAEVNASTTSQSFGLVKLGLDGSVAWRATQLIEQPLAIGQTPKASVQVDLLGNSYVTSGVGGANQAFEIITTKILSDGSIAWQTAQPVATPATSAWQDSISTHISNSGQYFIKHVNNNNVYILSLDDFGSTSEIYVVDHTNATTVTATLKIAADDSLYLHHTSALQQTASTAYLTRQFTKLSATGQVLLELPYEGLPAQDFFVAPDNSIYTILRNNVRKYLANGQLSWEKSIALQGSRGCGLIYNDAKLASNGTVNLIFFSYCRNSDWGNGYSVYRLDATGQELTPIDYFLNTATLQQSLITATSGLANATLQMDASNNLYIVERHLTRSFTSIFYSPTLAATQRPDKFDYIIKRIDSSGNVTKIVHTKDHCIRDAENTCQGTQFNFGLDTSMSVLFSGNADPTSIIHYANAW